MGLITPYLKNVQRIRKDDAANSLFFILYAFFLIKKGILKQSLRPLTSLRLASAIGWYIAFFLCFVSSQTLADITNSKQAKAQLETLNHQIASLQDHLSDAQNKRTLLTQELRVTEKKIDLTLRQLSPLKNKMIDQNQAIARLRAKINHLNQDIISQKLLLKAHLTIFYQTRSLQPVGWLLDPKAFYTHNRLAIYTQYLMQARQRIIKQIQITKNTVFEQEQALTNKLSRQNSMERTLKERQQQLEESKHYQLIVLNQLKHTIETKQSTLEEYQQDRKKLTALLAHLLKISSLQTTTRFANLQKKLPKPLAYPKTAAQKMHQGLTFFAPEGTPVVAVYPGKVVFSDWLKGYGLLLILDHGQGYMTLYGHNQTLLKTQGETVLQNESIAAVGHTGGLQQDGLYFEIRHRGKALSPLDWLL